MDIKPIETEYNGYRFRSRLEARWAVFFDSAGIEYEYEPEGFELPDGKKYLPDFYLPSFNVYCEVKRDCPETKEDIERCSKFVYWGSAIRKILILSTIPSEKLHNGLWHFPVIYYSPKSESPVIGWFYFSSMGGEKVVAGNISSSRYKQNFWLDDGKIKCATEFLDGRYPWEVRQQEIPFTPRAELDTDLRYGERLQESIDLDYGYSFNVAVFDALRKARQARFEHGEKPMI